MRKLSLTLVATAVAASLSACGGGGSSSDAATPSSVDTASADSASATEAPTEVATVMEASAQSMQAMVATSNAGSAIVCPGGGTASYSLSGGLDDGALQSGEVYQVTFDQCKGAYGAVAVSGQATFSFTSVNTSSAQANVSYTNLSAVLPLSTVTLNGSAKVGASLVYTRGTTGPTLSAQSTLVASGLSLTRSTASRSTSYAVDALSLTRTTQLASDGSVTATGVTGTATLSTTRLSGTYSATLAFTSQVSFSNGLPTSGSWRVTLPNSFLDVTATPSLITIQQDLGKNGSYERTFTYVPGTWADTVD